MCVYIYNLLLFLFRWGFGSNSISCRKGSRGSFFIIGIRQPVVEVLSVAYCVVAEFPMLIFRRRPLFFPRRNLRLQTLPNRRRFFALLFLWSLYFHGWKNWSENIKELNTNLFIYIVFLFYRERLGESCPFRFDVRSSSGISSATDELDWIENSVFIIKFLEKELEKKSLKNN